MGCEISQPKRGCCENHILLRKNFTALRCCCEKRSPLRNHFAAAKTLLGTQVPFRSQVPPFRSCELAAIFFSPGDPPFRRRGTISKGVSQLRNHPLAHECHFVAPYTRFAAVKSMPKFLSLQKRLTAAKFTPHRCEKSPLLRKGTVTLGVLFKRYKCHFFLF